MNKKDNQTRQKILTVALELIREKGYDSVTINDICAAAEVSKHTFYYYFESKDELLSEFRNIPRGLTAGTLSSILAAENNLEQYWLLLEPGMDFFMEVGPEIAKRILIANLAKDKGTFDERANADVAAKIAIIKKAQDAGEILNASQPSMLVQANFVQFLGLAYAGAYRAASSTSRTPRGR